MEKVAVYAQNSYRFIVFLQILWLKRFSVILLQTHSLYRRHSLKKNKNFKSDTQQLSTIDFDTGLQTVNCNL